MAPKNKRRPEYNDVSMPILSHLEELRRRLFFSAIAVLVGALGAYVIMTQIPGFDLLDFIARPATQALGKKMIYTGTTDMFKMYFNAGFVVAMIIASPVIFYQVWGFVAPAMYAKEKRVVIPVIFAAVALFLAGVALAYVVVLPMTMTFFLGFETEAAVPMITLSDFISMAIYLCVGFGICFQLPIVILLLSAIGIVTPDMLRKFRRYAVVGVLILSAAVTPDPTTMFFMWIPLYGLYEVSIWIASFVKRWRDGREDALDEEEDEVIAAPSRGEPRRLDQLG